MERSLPLWADSRAARFMPKIIELRNLPTPRVTSAATVGATRESKGAEPSTVVRAVGSASHLFLEKQGRRDRSRGLPHARA
jgi:hypothetical protein